MTRRAWILALEVGLCGSLPACTTPLGNIGAASRETVAYSAEPPETIETGEHPSPYAMIPRQENREKPSKPVISREELASRTPYAGLAQHPEVPPPEPLAAIVDPSRESTAGFSKPVISSHELASRTPYAGLDPHAEPPPPEPPVATAASLPESTKVADMKQIATAAPEPPPPASPPASEVSQGEATGAGHEGKPFSPYAEIPGQSPKPISTAFSGPALFSQPTSPYAQSLHQPSSQSPATAQKLAGGIPSPSPYAAVSGQPIMISATRTSAEKVEPVSPYAVTSTESAEPKSAPHGDPTSATPLGKQESIGQLQPAKFPEQPELHAIQESPVPLSPQVELELASDSVSGCDRPIIRKGDESPLLGALRNFLDKRPTEALNSLKRYDEPNQELLLRLFPLIVRLAVRDLTRADAEKAIEIMEDLNNLTGVPVDGDLAIGKLCLCKHIKTFGDYEPFPEDHPFQPRDLVWIYAEVRNFTSDRRDIGNGEIVYETRLKTTARITNNAGTHEWPLCFDRRYGPDRSRTLRHDYWDNLSFTVPDLPPGIYTLWLKVVDEPTSRVKERSVDFQVVPPKGL